MLRDRGLVLLGCGNMGRALLEAWLDRGLSPMSVWVHDPKPSDWLMTQQVRVNTPLPPTPAAVVIAVKPQKMTEALDTLVPMGGGLTLFLSVAAGMSIHEYEQILGAGTPIVRAMPNTPASVGEGISAMIGNTHVSQRQSALAKDLLSAVGQVVPLDDESQMDAVTAVSGSGPAYVFLMIEAMAMAGVAEGLPIEMAMRLSKATVTGAASLAEQSTDDPAQLRRNVTSPGGTTEAAMKVLLDDKEGLSALLRAAIRASANRSRELGR